MKPICLPCQRFFRMRKQGFYFIEQYSVHPRAQPGTAEPSMWKPYKIWSGDLWECKGCGATIVSGVGFSPISEHYKPDFEDWKQRLNASQLQVNDC